MGVKYDVSHKGKNVDELCFRTGAEDNIWSWERCNSGRLAKLHKEELHNVHTSPEIIRLIKSKRIWWLAGHVARVGKMINTY